MAPPRARGGVPRRWPRRLLIGLNVFVAFCLVATALAYGYVRWKFGQIDRVAIGCVILSCEEDDPGEPTNWLLVGTDSRERVTAADAKFLGTEEDSGGLRTDTMMVLRVDPRAAKAAILSIPRDLYVNIAGTSRMDRINTAVFPTTPDSRRTTGTTARRSASGVPATSSTIAAEKIEDGIPRLVATIRQTLDLEINHYAEVDFIGFRSIVDAVGGVTMPFPAPARDKLSGLSIKSPGCIELDGDQALGFVRSRNLETFESGRWRTDPTADIGRIQRQQEFVRRTIRRAISLGVLANPNAIRKLVNAGVDNVKLDEEVEQDDIVKLAKRFKSLDSESVEMFTVPADNFRTRQGAAVLRIRQSEADEILRQFQAREDPDNGPIPNIPPSTVRVRVLNGTGVSGQGGKAALELKEAGFLTNGIGDADRYGYSKSLVRYGRGQKLKAQLLAAYVVGGADIKEDLSLQGVDVVLITGAGYEGIRAPGAPAPSTTAPTSTTAPPAAPQAKGALELNC